MQCFQLFSRREKKWSCFPKHYTFKTWLRDEKYWRFCVFTTSSQFQTRMSWAETSLFSQKCETIVMLAQPVSVISQGLSIPVQKWGKRLELHVESLYKHNMLLIHELAKQYNDKFLKIKVGSSRVRACDFGLLPSSGLKMRFFYHTAWVGMYAGANKGDWMDASSTHQQ